MTDMHPHPPSPAPPGWLHRGHAWSVRHRRLLLLLAVVTVFALSSLPNTHPPRVRGLDKAQHVAEYFVLALLLLNVTTRGYTRLGLATVGSTWVATVAIALADETYQRLVPGRSFDLWDVTASAAGALIAVAVVVLVRLLVMLPARRRA